MKRLLVFGILCLWSVAAQGQQLRKFSGPDAYVEELGTLLKGAPKDQASRINDSLLPSILSDYDEEQLALLIDVSNNLLRKRIVQPADWERLFSLLDGVNQNFDYALWTPVLQELKGQTRTNSSGIIKTYVARLDNAVNDQSLIEEQDLHWYAPYSEWYLSFEDKQPVFTIVEGDLMGTFKTDSTFVLNPKLKYYPRTGLVEAEGGTCYWTRVGYSADTLRAELSTWSFDAKKGHIVADSVTLHSALYFTEPVVGSFEERLSGNGLQSRSFPRFTSYRSDFKMPSIFKDVHFEGGFAVLGDKYFGASSDSALCSLIFEYKQDTIIVLRSRQINLNPHLLKSQRVTMTLYMEEDSLFHPYSTMRFDPVKGELVVTAGEMGLGYAPIVDSYHNLDISYDQLTWLQETPIVNLKMLNLGAAKTALMESSQYFRVPKMEQLQGLQMEHPFYELRNVAYGFGYEDIPMRSLARALRMPYEKAENWIFDLAIEGFVAYNVSNNLVSIKPKLFEYLENYEGKRDYDVIQIVSRIPEGPFAQISLLSNVMEVAGVSAIAVSDSQKVDIYPRGGRIAVHENLDFTFDGRINAGLFSYWGQEYRFDYESFSINMPQIDSMRFKVKQFDAPPGELAAYVNVQTVLQNLTGRLLIDDAFNKSSRVYFPEYPIFQATNNSYIYYDKPETYGGVYDRDRFYVELNPFTIDSLDNATTDGINFDGTFVSGGIFPTFYQDITVQRDYSLGFETALNEQAYGKGSYQGSLTLSNAGLHANGVINYLESEAVSPDFVFFLDSAKGRATTMDIAAATMGRGNPHAYASTVGIRWLPYENEYWAQQHAEPFALYDELGMTVEGKLLYKPEGLDGFGTAEYGNAQHISEVAGFEFKQKSFASDDQDFRVKVGPNAKEWAFKMLHSSGNVDFEQQQGVFDKLDPAEYIQFPANQYAAYMDHADWDMDDAFVDVRRNGNAQAYMVSTHPLQDSLDFPAGYARFQLRPGLLEGFEVPHMDVADSRIIPDSGYVVIDKNAEMHQLHKAEIIANRYSKHHKIYDASLRVKGKYRYVGTGSYDYKDEEGNIWPLKFESIKPDTSGTTIADAQVAIEDDFYLSPYFGYNGGVQLHADRTQLFFKGEILIQHACRNIQTTWFRIESFIEPSDIVITLPINEEGKLRDNLFNGIYISQDSLGGHSNFLSKYADRADIDLLTATGVLFYDREQQSYIITTSEKLNDPMLPDPYLAFANMDCELNGTGRINLLNNTGRMTSLLGGGVTHNLNTDAVTVDGVWLLDFHMDKKSFSAMAGLFSEATGNNRHSEDNFVEGVKAILSAKDANKLLDELALSDDAADLPKTVEKSTMLLSGIPMTYDGKTRLFRYHGDMTWLSAYDVPVFATMEGFFELRRKRRGDEFTLLLDNGTDYLFIQYRNNVLSIRSSDEDFNDAVIQTKPKDRSLSAKKDLPQFTYNLASKGKVLLFKRRFGVED